MILKYAFRNLRRFPWRTTLYGAMIFFIVVSITASLFIWNATAKAKETLRENYVFVASLVKRENTKIPLLEIFKCLDHESVEAFNVSMSEANGTIPAGDAMLSMPSEQKKGEKKDIWFDEFGCDLLAVENLALTYPFFSGECTIREGTGLTQEGYNGHVMEILIPWWLADQYGIQVGDTVNRRYIKTAYYGYLPCKVVGIYESSATSPDIKSYPAYIPLAIAEIDYGQFLNDLDPKTVERADFILSDRNDFESFVAHANENGINFKATDIIFNNSTYDVLTSALDNIHTIALLVFLLVLLVGSGLILFVTVYLCTSRTEERKLLIALGMKKMTVGIIIAIELCVIFIFSVFLGFWGGRSSAEVVCRMVNDTVLARASASERIQNIQSSDDFEITMPLEKPIKIELSIKQPCVSQIDVALNKMDVLEENEIGVSRHTFYVMMSGTEADFYFEYGKVLSDEEQKLFDYIQYERELVTLNVVGVSDLSVIELNTLREYPYEVIGFYVSENSPYANEEAIFMSTRDRNMYTQIYVSGFDAAITPNKMPPSTARYTILGTYKDNDYCSGTDILISLENYHKLYANISVTETDKCFKRIHEIYMKEND